MWKDSVNGKDSVSDQFQGDQRPSEVTCGETFCGLMKIGVLLLGSKVANSLSDETQPHSIMLPSPCLTVGTVS